MAQDIQITPSAGMPPVTTETQGQTSSAGSEQIVPSNAALEAEQNAQTAAGNVAEAEQAVTPAIAETIEGKAQGLDAQAQAVEQANQERDQLIAARMPAIKDAERQAKEAEDRYINHQF